MREINKLLPDFDTIFELLSEIRKLNAQKMLMEVEIRKRVKEVYQEVLTNKKYYVNNKPPSASFIAATWEQTGLDNELIQLREDLVMLTVDAKYAENKLSVFKDMIDVWRTLSANERSAVV